MLLLLVKERDALHVLFIERPNGPSAHAGQVSFPGGGVEPADESRLQTALRETYEEIGVPPDRVAVLGRLDDYVTITNFHVVPFVGLVDGPLELKPNPDEVADVFLVPLRTLLKMEQSLVDRPEVPNIKMRSFVFDDHVIWGATCSMLDGFLSMIRDDFDESRGC